MQVQIKDNDDHGIKIGLSYYRIKQKFDLLRSEKEKIISKYAKDEHEIDCTEMTDCDYELYIALDETLRLLQEILSLTN